MAENGVTQMIGFARGIAADGKVNRIELDAFAAWVLDYPDGTLGFSATLVAQRLIRIHHEGGVTEEGRRELQRLLEAMDAENGG